VDILPNYDGAVEPGGPGQQRTLDRLTVTKISVGPMDNNVYLLVCRTTGEALLIDAANDAERLMDLLGHGPDRPELHTIVTTHRHGDH
jgi:glyoxylase-like metal-dependent hydrolase (beta-lactamase superfamily II)